MVQETDDATRGPADIRIDEQKMCQRRIVQEFCDNCISTTGNERFIRQEAWLNIDSVL